MRESQSVPDRETATGHDTVSDAEKTLNGVPAGWRECHICRDGLDRKRTAVEFCPICNLHFCSEEHGAPPGQITGLCLVCYYEQQWLTAPR